MSIAFFENNASPEASYAKGNDKALVPLLMRLKHALASELVLTQITYGRILNLANLITQFAQKNAQYSLTYV